MPIITATQPAGDAFNAGWYPDAAGYVAWTFDPIALDSSYAPSAGFPYFVKFQIPVTQTFANVAYDVSTAGSGVQLPVNVFIGVYDSTGQQRGVTAALDSAVQSSGYKTAALVLTSGQSLTIAGSPGSFGWFGFLIGTQSTTNVQLAIGQTNTQSSINAYNGQSAATALRYGRLAGGQTALPLTFTPSSLVQPSSGVPWFAGY